MYCYRRLKDLRNDKGLTQGDIAKILGTSQQQYSKYEIGVQEIPAHHIITLARYYHTSADYLLGLTDNPKPFM